MYHKQYLSRREASEYLTSQGLPVAVPTLAKYATTGGGPFLQKFGRRCVVYKPTDLDAWASGRLEARRSTSVPAANVDASVTEE
jgi:hypothetical protein